MTFSRNPFSIVKHEIQRIFNCENYSKHWELLPEDIQRLSLANGIALTWVNTPNWDNEDYNYSNEEFLNIAYINVFSSKRIYLVTDECFKTKEAFCITSTDLIAFIEEFYEAEYHMEFPQRLDFIFVVPEENFLSILYHEGVRTQYSSSS